MKRIIFLIFLMAGFVQAQEFGDPSFYDSVTTVSQTSTFQLRQSGVTKTLTWSRLNSLLGSGDSLRAADNTWTGANDFTNTMQMPSTLLSTLTRGVGFNSGLFSWVADDTIRTGADRAWVLTQISDSGFAVDTNQFALKDGTNTFSALNIFSSVITTSLGMGLTNNSGYAKLPVYTGTNEGTEATGSVLYNSTDNRLRIYDVGESVWYSFLDSNAILSLVQTGAYLQTSGTQTGLSSNLTWSSGGITLGTDGTFIPPYHADPSSTLATGEIGWDWRGGFKELWYNNNGEVTRIVDESNLAFHLDSLLGVSAPPDSSDLASPSAEVEWTDKNYSQGIYGDTDEDFTITVQNYAPGWVAFYVEKTGQTVTINISGVTIEWASGTTPTFNDQRYYKVQLEYYSATVCLGSYVWYD